MLLEAKLVLDTAHPPLYLGCLHHEVLLEARLLLDTADPPLYLETERVTRHV